MRFRVGGASGLAMFCLLALLRLAALFVGELATSAPGRLPGLPGAEVLVVVTQVDRLRPVQDSVAGLVVLTLRTMGH